MTAETTERLNLPSSAADFVQAMDIKAKNLIGLGVWRISMNDYRGWFAQFYSDDEQFFAACLIDNLIYRCEEQFTAGLQALFAGKLRWELEDLVPGQSDLDLIDALTKADSGKILVVPAIGENESPTKSAMLITRRLKKVLGVNDKIIVWPRDIRTILEANLDRSELRAVILVDDFIGTGNQIKTYLKSNFGELTQDIKWVYAIVAAHASGLDCIRKNIPLLKVFSVEIFEEEHGFFSEPYWESISNGKITAEQAKDFYLNFIKSRGLDTSDFTTRPLGYGGKALCLGFQHGTPNNSLPILWARHDNWLPLLER